MPLNCFLCDGLIGPGEAYESDYVEGGASRCWHATCNPRSISVPQNQETQDQLAAVMLNDGKVHEALRVPIKIEAVPFKPRQQLELAAKLILAAIGEDTKREGLRDTPRRFADAWLEFAGHTDKKTWTTFASYEADQLVIVKDIRIWSVCEHHLMPFWCDITIGYIAHGTILGLSKFARIAEEVAHKLQTQERIAQEIADRLCTKHGEVKLSPDVAVMAKGEHTCLAMRGAKKDHTMLNTVLRGKFKSDASLREEFYSLARG